jgi:hypothetical protein
VNVPPGVEPPGQDRGPSDYDIRQTFASAISYAIPRPGSGIWRSILGNWSTDSIVYARSASPVNIVTGLDPFNTGFLSGAYGTARPNVVPGVSFYLSESNAPGGRIINAAAFSIPATGQGDLGRNTLRGFGATQVDLTLCRQFRLTERVSLQARGVCSTFSTTPISEAPTTIFIHLPACLILCSGNRLRRWPTTWEAAARAAVSTRCTKSADRVPFNWP